MIIVAACKDECVNHLSNKCKLWFTAMGSKEIWKLKYRRGFVFIGTSGKPSSALEKRGISR